MPKPHNYLPKLKPSNDDQMQQPDAGRWHDGDAQRERRVGMLANALEDPSRLRRIRSVPDPWARMMLFARALFDELHQMHEQVLGEWRGVLALVGLKHRLGFTELLAEPIAMDGSQPGGSFLATVARMKPGSADCLVKGATWDQFHILRWHGQQSKGQAAVFGYTSPTTLVGTGVDYSNVFLSQEVPWFVNGALIDPLQVENAGGESGSLSIPDRESLARWLNYVADELLTHEREHVLRRDLLIAMLQAYAEELKKDAGTCAKAELEDNGLKLTTVPAYTPMSVSIKRKSPVLTDLNILGTRAVNKTYVLYDPDIGNQFQPVAKPRDIVFFETDTLASAPRRYDAHTGKTGVLKKDNASKREIVWCNKSFFFQDDLIYEQVEPLPGERAGYENTFPECRPLKAKGRAANRNIVLPLSEQAGLLFTPSYLADNFEIDWQLDGSARCTFRLEVKPLSADPAQEDAGATRDIVLEHTYYPKDMVKVNALPVVCVWPDFQLPDERSRGPEGGWTNRWQRYYTYEIWPNTSKAEEFAVTPLEAVVDSRPLIVQSGGVFQLTVTSKYPEVLVCRMPFNANKPRPHDNNPPTGLLLLKTPLRIDVSPGMETALGVDFGTTGTTLYGANIKDSGEMTDPLPMRLTDRIVQVTARPESELRELTRHHFIPVRLDVKGKTLSVFQTHRTVGGRQALLDGHALFQDFVAKDPFVWGEPSSIITDLKWGTKTREREAAEAFLSQLCMQSIAELIAAGCNTVDIRYSYPTAMSNDEINRLQLTWKTSVEEIQKVTSVPLTLNKGGSPNYEAVAATRYFSEKKKMVLESGAITMDIGGGTTDVAFWNAVNDSATLIGHSSVLFAGRNMFQAALSGRNMKLLKEIEKSIVLPTLSENQYSSAMDAELDAVIARDGELLLKRLPHAVETSDAVQDFVYILELGMTGIAFYTGLFLGQLIQSKAYDVQETSRIQVFVGGNAARLLHWCDLGRFHEGTEFYKRFCQSILAGASVAAPEALAGKSVTASISDDPKHEVAYGLVARALKVEKSELVAPVAGEDFRVAETQHPWSDAPSIDDLLSGRIKVKRDLPVFQSFLKQAGIELTDSERENLAGAVNEALTRMKDDIEKAIEDAKSSGRRGGPPENLGRKLPLFILALRSLIDSRIKTMRTRTGDR